MIGYAVVERLRQISRVCTFLINTDRQGSRLHADGPVTLVSLGLTNLKEPMTLGLATERTKGPEPDHMVEFREGVELLKNKYPEKALVKLRRAFESDKRNPYYISFLGLSMARAEQKWDHALKLFDESGIVRFPV